MCYLTSAGTYPIHLNDDTGHITVVAEGGVVQSGAVAKLADGEGAGLLGVSTR